MSAPASNVKDLCDRAALDEAIGLINDALSSYRLAAAPQVRHRSLGRVADSAQRHQGLVTVRTRHLPSQALANGAAVRRRHRTDGTRARRAGEPRRLALIEFRAGS